MISTAVVVGLIEILIFFAGAISIRGLCLLVFRNIPEAILIRGTTLIGNFRLIHPPAQVYPKGEPLLLTCLILY